MARSASSPPSTASSTVRARALDLAGRVACDLGWIIVVVGLLAAVGRMLAHDAHLLLIWANSFSVYLYAPALLILPFAVWRRRWRLAVASGLLVLALIVWVSPDFFSRGAQSAHASDAKPTGLRIFNANLYCKNPDLEGMLGEIRAADPDVILLQEYSPRWYQAFQTDEFFEHYPHRIFHIREDAFGIALYSKRPLLKQKKWFVGDVPMLDVQTTIDQRPIRIINWHPLPPRNLEYVDVWRKQYAELFERIAGDDQPLLIVGDFNATQHAACMEQLAEIGFLSAHESIGRGYAVTYPNGTSRVPPIRLDHALMSRHWKAVQIQEGTGRGSDHKPLIADFVLAD